MNGSEFECDFDSEHIFVLYSDVDKFFWEHLMNSLEQLWSLEQWLRTPGL